MCDRFLHPSRHNRWQKPFRRYQKILKINLTNFANIFKNFRDFCFFSAWDFHFSMSVFSRTTNSIQTNINSIISKRFLAILISQMASSRWSAAWMFEKKKIVWFLLRRILSFPICVYCRFQKSDPWLVLVQSIHLEAVSIRKTFSVDLLLEWIIVCD